MRNLAALFLALSMLIALVALVRRGDVELTGVDWFDLVAYAGLGIFCWVFSH